MRETRTSLTTSVDSPTAGPWFIRHWHVASFGLALLLAAAVGARSGSAEDARKDSGKEDRTKFIKAEFAKWKFSETRSDGSIAVSDPVPEGGAQLSLRYTNPVGNLVQDGATCLFRHQGVPVAAWSISIRGPDQPLSVWVEVTSLARGASVCEKDGSPRWAPGSGTHIGKALDGAEPPDDKPVRRLIQMRDISRRFTANHYKKDDPNPTMLRLLTQPLDRYRHEKSGIVDGAVFAFVEANDPEFLLVVEAVKDAVGKGGWRYSVARMTSRKSEILKDGKMELQVENYWEGPRQRTDLYQEQPDGKFVELTN